MGKIGIKYGIGKCNIQYIVNTNNKMKKKTGPKFKITKEDRRHIQSEIFEANKENKKCSSMDIISKLNLNVSRSTVCRCLKEIKYSYKNIPRKFKLSTSLKKKRLEAARQWIIEGLDWKNVIFSDEKYFTLHGIDSFYCWTQDGKKFQRIKRVIRSSGFMVWAMILPNGLLSYQIIRRKINSSEYIGIIKKALFIIKLNFKNRIILQQDNAPMHVSALSKRFFSENEINTLTWPAHSPDLNIIENVWAILSRFVYNGPIIKNLMDLEKRLYDAVKNFNECKNECAHNLYNSIPSRLVTVIAKRGDFIKIPGN